jgi:hypothetical protein
VNAGGLRPRSAYNPAIRIAVIDTDSGFVTVLAKRAEVAGWELSRSTGPVPPRDLVAMKLNALLIDPAVLGDEVWSYLERVSSMLPELGLVVCTGRTTVAQRVRGLRLGVDEAVPPRGGARPSRSDHPPPPPRPPRGRRGAALGR